ncbi:MAG: hypothetical protein ACOCXA_06455 [Planctomycetota bacterium]
MSRLVVLMLCCSCLALATASEHGNRVLAVVLEHLADDLQPELQQWSEDLRAEGYDPAVVTWDDDKTSTLDGNAHIIELYDMLQEQEREHDLFGVILIGRFPIPRRFVDPINADGKWYDCGDDGLMCVNEPFEPNPGHQNYAYWLSRIDARDGKDRLLEYGHEVELIQRYFARLHAWRTGQLRMPHRTAATTTNEFNILLNDEDAGEQVLREEYWRRRCTLVWPEYHYHHKSSSALTADSGEYLLHLSHGYKSGTSTQIIGMGFFYDTPARYQHVDIGACHVVGIGGMSSRALFAPHAGVIVSSVTDSWAKPAYREAMNEGRSYGEAAIENGQLITTRIYGDLTWSAKRFPSNEPPEITGLTLSGTQVAVGEELTLSVTATDPDDAPTTVYVYPQGWLQGKAPPQKLAYGETARITYQQPHTYTLRVVVEDGYGNVHWKDQRVVVVPDDRAAIRINCGGTVSAVNGPDLRLPDDADLVDGLGRRWLFDQGKEAGTWGFSGRYKTAKHDGDAIEHELPSLYQAQIKLDKANDPLTYSFPLAAGGYQVRVHAAAFEADAVGKSLLDVRVNDLEVGTALDAYADAGGRRKPVVWEWSVAHEGGDLSVRLQRNADSPQNAWVSAIEVLPSEVPEPLQRGVGFSVEEANGPLPVLLEVWQSGVRRYQQDGEQHQVEGLDARSDIQLRFQPTPDGQG